MLLRPRLLSLAVAASLALGTGAAVTSSPASAQTLPPAGTVLSTTSLPTSLWIPGTRKAWKLGYVSADAFGHRSRVTGTVFVPKGTPPKGGWPVVSWAHGTSGLADGCAPSRVGPAEKARDFAYLGTWMQQGYAIVATDYAGLGTAGLPAYLNGRSEAHNVVDMVKAGRSVASGTTDARNRLARKYVIIGQSQGGGAAIYTARYASAFGGPSLDYRGAVGTGTPANIEKALLPIGPKTPPAGLAPGVTSYIAYIFASLRHVHPELGIDGILTAEGKKYLRLAEQMCVEQFDAVLDGVNVGDWFTAPVATLPDFAQTLDDYMAMPTSGFDHPFFMANGAIDTDVPMALTAEYVATLVANGEPVTFKTYPTDHNGTMQASLPDSVPFVASLFR